jgi:hypothetical protein
LFGWVFLFLELSFVWVLSTLFVFGYLALFCVLVLSTFFLLGYLALFVLGYLAFIVWVFATGEPFSSLSFYQPYYASITIIIFTFVIPMI